MLIIIQRIKSFHPVRGLVGVGGSDSSNQARIHMKQEFPKFRWGIQKYAAWKHDWLTNVPLKYLRFKNIQIQCVNIMSHVNIKVFIPHINGVV